MDETTNTLETTPETTAETESETSGEKSNFAKFKDKVKARYEGEITSLKERINELEEREYNNNKKFFSETLKSQGFKGDDFDSFFDAHCEMDFNEMTALYRGLNMTGNTNQQVIEEPQIGSRSVIIGKNPATNSNDGTINSLEDFENASLDKQKEYLKSHPELFY